MELRGGGILPSEGKNNQAPGVWIPVTPSKPEQPSRRIYRLQSDSTSGGGLCSSSTTDNSVAYFGARGVTNQVQNLNNWGVCNLTVNTSFPGLNVSPCVNNGGAGNLSTNHELSGLSVSSHLNHSGAGNWPPRTQLSTLSVISPHDNYRRSNLPSQTHQLDLNINTQAQVTKNPTAECSKIPWNQLVQMAVEGRRNGSVSSFPILGDQVVGTQSNMANPLLINHSSSHASHIWSNNGNYTQQLPIGFHIPFHATSTASSQQTFRSHQTSPKPNLGALENGTNSFQLMPGAPDSASWRSRNCQSVECTNLFLAGKLNPTNSSDKRNEDCLANKTGQTNQSYLLIDLSSEKDRLHAVELPSSATESTVLKETLASQPNDCFRDFSQPVEQSPSSLQSTTTLNEARNIQQDQGFDLNQTPPQKAKRKKHRPKVVTEGKRKRNLTSLTPTKVKTPKQAKTPRPITPKQATREKRKYVRKTKGILVEDVRMFEKEHLMTNLDVRPDTAEQATPPADGRIGVESLPLRGWPKSSCRRVLNFDLEAEGDTIRSSSRRTPSFDLEDQTGKNRGGAGPINVGVQSQSQNSNSQPLGLQCTINLNFPTETQNSQSQPPCSHSQREDDEKDSGSLYSEPSRSNLLFGKWQEVTEVIEVIGENPSRYVTGNSFAQVDGYTSQPQTHKPLAPLPRTKVPKENMKALARNKNQKNVPPFVHMDQTDYTLLHTPDSSRNNLVDSLLPGLRSGLQSVARTEINLNLPVGSADVDIISNGSKRGYIETITSPDPHCVNSNSATYHELIREDNAQFPDSCKKQRAEVMHSEALSITPSKVKVVNHCGSFRLEVSNERRRQQTQSNFLEENYVPDSNDSNFLCEGYLQSMPLDFKFSAHNASRRELSSMLTHEEIQLLDRLPDMSGIEGSNPVEKNMKENNKALDLICNLCSMAAVTEDRQFPPPCEHEVNIGDQANLNCANLKTKKSESEIGKHKKKRPANVVELVSSSSTNNLAPKGHKARSDYTQTFPEDRGNLWNKCDTAMKHSNRCNTVPIHFVNNLQNTSSTLSPVVASPKGPIGEVVQRLKCFNIDGGGEKFMPEPHTALVPYTLGGHIVPYDGDPAKKRRKPRPKVYLDAETNRVWKLLMWKEGSENTGPEKAKQWEEERQVFVGRANSFIARMHLVQGDRRFSPWKGSVVDSVIGVFLTQNVSDHLSSSAFMALAAKFPFHSQASSHHSSEGIRKPPEESKLSLLGVDKWQGEVLNHAACNQSFTTVNEAGTAEEKEVASSIGPFGSNIWHGTADGANGKQVLVRDNGPPLHAELSQDRTDIPRLLEDIVSSQNSVSPQNSTNSGPQIIDQIGSIFDYNSEVVNSMTLFQDKVFNGSSTFMELLQLEGPQIIQELYCYEDGFESSNATTGMESEKRRLEFNGGLDSPCPSIYQMNVPQTQRKREFTLPTNSVVASEEVDHVEISTYESTSSLTSAISETSRAQGKEKASWLAMENMADSMVPPLSCSQNASVGDSPFVKEPVHSMLVSDHRSLSDTLQSKRNSGVLQVQSNSSCCNNLGEKSDVRDQSDLGDNNKPDKLKQAESNTKDARCGYEQGFKEATGETIRKEKKRVETRKAFDWDSLRRQVCSNGAKKQRRPETLDSLDYEALRSADVHEISNAIKERGMNNMLAERIKDFLNRLLREHGSVDLEWLRDVPPDKAKDYLLSIRGLGLKSVECVRLLTLHHVAFPVDTNVGRICVRLGWVPLQPLPESLQLHLLEMYPVLESIQKYLWPRLCKLDQRTLYELHYQMITFGKVFCTKSKPNCNACPMRAECKHFASAFASARLALPGPEEKGLVTSAVPLCTDRGHKVVINPIPLPQLKMAPYPQVDARVTRCEPIIEEPASPEAQGLDGSEIAIEDAFWEDESDEIPVIKLNFEEFSQNVQNYMHENMSLQEGDMSKALVALTPEAASIPVPKLKNVSRLRTEHQVYELPDSHELLKGLDLREPDDPCPYLLAIWTPGETAESVLPPEMFCNFRESGDLCDKKTCFACNSIREAHTQIVRGTLLMPCRTAMRGSFPLNGTYFQVNEVFADHDSSLQPIDVPRALLWNLPRRTVYFGSSVTTIFRGLTTEEIQLCFWRGFVCVRGFDREKRVPRPLMARLHLLASKLVKEPKGPKSVTGRAGEPLETDKK